MTHPENVAENVASPENIRDLFRWNDEAVDKRLREAIDSPEDLAELITSPAWGIYALPFLTPEFCKALTWFADTVGDYKPAPGDPYGRSEISTDRIDQLNAVMEELFNRYMKKLSEACYGYRVSKVIANFVLKYSMGTWQSMGRHFDDPAGHVTMVVVLNDGFTGGGLHFPRYEWTAKGVPPGTMVIFPSQTTHLHEGLTITSGERFALVFWLAGSGEDRQV